MSAAIEQATTASPHDEGLKVFVGNLSFETKPDDLKAIFAGKGELTDAQIISRGSRSLGYGFVTFKEAAAASAAISALDKSDYNGRTINVEIAKPSASTARGSIAKEAAAAAIEGGATGGERGGRRGRGRGRFRGRGGRGGGRRVPADGEAEGAAAGPATNGTPAAATTTTTDGITSGMGNLKVDDESQETATRGRGRGRGRGRNSRRVGPPAGEPSKTLLFVANLPFSMDNDGLKEVFTGYNVTSAHVVVRKHGPVSGRSKGFGFVDLATEAEQQNALASINGKEIEGRELQVKVAIETPHEPDSTIVAQ